MARRPSPGSSRPSTSGRAGSVEIRGIQRQAEVQQDALPGTFPPRRTCRRSRAFLDEFVFSRISQTTMRRSWSRSAATLLDEPACHSRAQIGFGGEFTHYGTSLKKILLEMTSVAMPIHRGGMGENQFDASGHGRHRRRTWLFRCADVASRYMRDNRRRRPGQICPDRRLHRQGPGIHGRSSIS